MFFSFSAAAFITGQFWQLLMVLAWPLMATDECDALTETPPREGLRSSERPKSQSAETLKCRQI